MWKKKTPPRNRNDSSHEAAAANTQLHLLDSLSHYITATHEEFHFNNNKTNMFVFVKPQRQQHSHTRTLKHTRHVTDSESLIGPIKKKWRGSL